MIRGTNNFTPKIRHNPHHFTHTIIFFKVHGLIAAIFSFNPIFSWNNVLNFYQPTLRQYFTVFCNAKHSISVLQHCFRTNEILYLVSALLTQHVFIMEVVLHRTGAVQRNGRNQILYVLWLHLLAIPG